jgi:uncharacterized protein (TIGR00297 family)
MAGRGKQAGAGFLAAAAISFAARKAGALTTSGALAATLVGGAVVNGAGTAGGGALVAFFVSSTLLGRLPAGDAFEQRRGRQRDAVQVLANGGAAAALALAAAIAPCRMRAYMLAGFAGTVATAAADTWATEIGGRSQSRPRSIATLQPVPAGTSGGVTVAGLAASVAGAATIAVVYALGRGLESSQDLTDVPPEVDGKAGELRCCPPPTAARARQASPLQDWVGERSTQTSPLRVDLRRQPCQTAIAACLGGIAGALVDSYLGATVQQVRFCDACGVETELTIHRCGVPTRPVRGASWCTNDVVNFLATAAGAVLSILIARLNGGESRPAPRRGE